MGNERVEIDISMIDNASKKLDGVIDAVNNTSRATDNLNARMINLSSVINVIETVGRYVGGAVKSIIDVGAEAEKTSVAFKTLIGDEETATKVLGELNDYAKATPFSNMQINDAAKTLLNFGVNAQQVNGLLRQLGDISMGDANKLNSLSVVMGQVSSAGKMSGQDLMQFINAGFNPLKELADMTGKKYTELQDAMSKGAITTDMVAAAIAHATSEGGQFAGMADSLSQTFSGRLSTVMGNLQQVAIGLFEKMKPSLMQLLSVADALIDKLPAVVDTLSSAVSFCAEWSAVIIPLISAVAAYNAAMGIASAATKAWTAVQYALNLAMSLNPIGLVIAGIAALTTAIVVCWNKFETFRAVIKTTWDTVKDFGAILKDYVIDRIKGIISGLGNMGSAIAKLFKGDFSAAIETAKKGVKELSGYEAAANAVSKARNVVGNVGSNFRSRLADERAKKETANDKIDKNVSSNVGIPSLNAPSSVGAPVAAKGSAEAIASGGTRNTQITINFSREMVKMEFTGGYLDNKEQVESNLAESLLRVLSAAKASI